MHVNLHLRQNTGSQLCSPPSSPGVPWDFKTDRKLQWKFSPRPIWVSPSQAVPLLPARRRMYGYLIRMYIIVRCLLELSWETVFGPPHPLWTFKVQQQLCNTPHRQKNLQYLFSFQLNYAARGNWQCFIDEHFQGTTGHVIAISVPWGTPVCTPAPFCPGLIELLHIDSH